VRPTSSFLPARPETVDGGNWRRLFDDAGRPRCRVIVEGANSYITPEARQNLQRGGVILMRDASANKCGVISSSYEIIANLMLSDEEFLDHKEEYVADVLAILEKRAEEEARVILARHRQAGGALLYTEITGEISAEINGCYARLFAYLQAHPEVGDRPLYRRAILDHLPAMLAREGSPFRTRSTGCRIRSNTPSWPGRSPHRSSTMPTATRPSWSRWRGTCGGGRNCIMIRMWIKASFNHPVSGDKGWHERLIL